MKKLLSCVAIASSILFSASSLAQGAFFGADFIKLSSSVQDFDFDTTALQIRGSFPVENNIDIEGTLAIGISDDSMSDTYYDPFFGVYFTDTIKGSLSQALGVFAKFHSDPSGGFQFYGKLGLQMVKYKVEFSETALGTTVFSASTTFDDTGLAYGVGGSFNLSGSNGAVVVEYMKLPAVDANGSDIDSSALSIGFQMAL